MKIKIIFLVLFTQILFSQEKSIVYENDATAYYNKAYDEFTKDPTYCDLTLKPDFTFSFYSRPGISCWSWREIKGTWKQQNNVYTFSSQYEVSENDTRFIFSKDSTTRYLLKFRTDKNSELKNRTIKLDYTYDFDAQLDDFEKITSFDQGNIIEIPFLEIPNLDKLASIRIEYQLSPNEKRFAYITENKMVNEKLNDIPNIVEIEFVEVPKKEIVYRTTIGKLNDEKMEIISSVKTKTSLPYYLRETGFEKYYELRK